jgi:hypothetical protein
MSIPTSPTVGTSYHMTTQGFAGFELIVPLRASQSIYSHLRQMTTGPFVLTFRGTSLAFRIDAGATESPISACRATGFVFSFACHEIREGLCAKCVPAQDQRWAVSAVRVWYSSQRALNSVGNEGAPPGRSVAD